MGASKPNDRRIGFGLITSISLRGLSAALIALVLTGCDFTVSVTRTRGQKSTAITNPERVASGLTWSTFPYSSSLSITAIWTASHATDLFNQSVQFYSDASCTTPEGSPLVVASTLESLNYTALAPGTYTFVVLSTSTAGDVTASGCSLPLTVDLAPPNAATALAWTETTPHAGFAVNANWTVSNSTDLQSQEIRFYADGTCTAASGGALAIASTATHTYAWTAPADGTYSFIVTTIDAAGNRAPSACSTGLALDGTAPAAATPIAWAQTSPVYLPTLVASWTKSVATDLANQKIQFYADGTCSTVSGALVDLASATKTKYAFTAPTAGTYSYVLQSLDTVGNATNSACSSAMVLGLKLTPSDFSAPLGEALAKTFVGSGGTAPYSYSIVSGPGAINSATGAYTVGAGTTVRTRGSTTVVRVQDANGATAQTTITHARLAINGLINSVAYDSTANVAYVGGSFSDINPNAAYHVVSANTTTGSADNLSIMSKLNGAVYAIAYSGTSVFLGGTFTKYGTASVQNLVKVDLATGLLDTAFTQTTGTSSGVYSLLVSGTSLYVGGAFTSYRGDNRAYRLAKVDLTTGDLDTTFNATASSGPNGTVTAIVLSGTYLFIGGEFTNYRGNTRGIYLAKIDATTGALDTAQFNTVAGSGPNSSVTSLVVSGTSLFVGGYFTAYRGDTKGYYLAKVDTTTGALETAQFNTTASTGPQSYVFSMVLSGTSLYVGGYFTNYRGDTKGRFLAKVDTTTGALDTASFNAAAGVSSAVTSLALSGTDLYAVGVFASYRTDTRGYRIIKLAAGNGALDTTFNANAGSGPNGLPTAVAVSGTSVLVGGTFTAYRGTYSPYLVKLSLDDWTFDTAFTAGGGPNALVYTVLLSGSDLYVGGNFTTYRGSAKGYYLAKVDTTTGALDTATFNTTDNTGPNAYVRTLAKSGTDLYVGGNFTQYRADARGVYLAKVSATTGALETATFHTAATTGPSGLVYSIVVSGADLYVGGNFTSYRGDNKGYYLVKASSSTGVMDTATFNTTASTGPNASIRAMLLMGGSLYVGGAFTLYRTDSKGIYLAKLNPSTGAMDTAAFNTQNGVGPGNTVSHITPGPTAAKIYAAGGFTWYRSDSNGIFLAAASATTGAMDSTFNSTPSFEGDPYINAYSAYLAGNTVNSVTTLASGAVLVGGLSTYYRGDRGSPSLVLVSATDGSEL